MPKPLNESAAETPSSNCADRTRLQTTAYVRTSSREHVTGWEALRFCARSEPGCIRDRAAVILLQAFSSGKVGLSHRNGLYREVFGQQDWTHYTVNLESGAIDHPSGVNLSYINVSAQDLATWIGERQGGAGKPSRVRRPARAENTASAHCRIETRGRPTSAHIIFTEFRRRADAREVLPTLAGEAEHLSKWLLTTWPDAVPMRRSAIENRIRRLYQQWRATKKWVHVGR